MAASPNATSLPAMQGGLTARELMVPLAIVGIIFLMIVPVPPFLLDLFLALSITLSLVVLLVSVYLIKPLEFSVFPSVLLLSTLFRLSLNVASARLILLRGNEGTDAAGAVIKAFGQFVVGGNYAVGIVIFLILVVINFVVITKGAGRIAEVAARFTLDAMPGKQMSIDADLNAGFIEEKEARRRRREIEREADFCGAMDGASKFIRGEAVAGIIIIVIDVLGGFFIGVFQLGLDMKTAAETYTILTIGDGLIAQIPALLVSTAAGIMVSRAAAETNLGEELGKQLFMKPKALATASGVLAVLGLVPGLPHVAFLLLSLIAGTGAYFIGQIADVEEAPAAAPVAPELTSEEKIEKCLAMDLMELEIGYGLIPLVDPEQGGDLLERIRAVRRQMAQERGFIVPSIHIRDNLEIKPQEYAIRIKGVEIARGEVRPGSLLALNPGQAVTEIPGIPTTEPAFGLPAKWIEERDRETAQMAGFTVVDPTTVVATHITEIIKRHAHEIITRQDVQKLLDGLKEHYPKVVEEVVPAMLPLGTLLRVLQNLLHEQVSVKDLLTIMETLGNVGPMVKDPDMLTEYVRQALSRSITQHFKTADNKIYVVSLEKPLEDMLEQAIQRTEMGNYLALEPNIARMILQRLADGVRKCVENGCEPIILCSPAVRPYLKRLTERAHPELVVLSFQEVTPTVTIHSLGTVGLSYAN
ncbi:MAG TPA: flagellar biosynthesis protein FlhA [Candidatus Deferrimicrobiaceae bacterium]